MATTKINAAQIVGTAGSPTNGQVVKLDATGSTGHSGSLNALTASYFKGDGSGLTGVSADGMDVTASAAAVNMPLVFTQGAQTDGGVGLALDTGMHFNPNTNLLTGPGGLTVAGAIAGATTVDASTDFTVDGLVLTADTITNDAALSIVSTGLTLNASLDIALSADGDNITMDDGTTTMVDFNLASNAPTLKLMDGAQVANYCSIGVAANGATTITTVDTDAAAANLIITADGTVDIDSAGALTLDSGAGIALEPAAGSAVLIDGAASFDGDQLTGLASVTSTAFVGTLSTVAQPNITSLGTIASLVATTADIDAGTVDAVIGGTTPAAGTFTTLVGTSLNCQEGNITNVGAIGLDSIGADDGSSFSMASNWTNAGRVIANLGTVSAATSITATDLIGTNVDGILGADTARAANVTTLGASSTITAGARISLTGVLECETGVADEVFALNSDSFVYYDATNKCLKRDLVTDVVSNQAGQALQGNSNGQFFISWQRDTFTSASIYASGGAATSQIGATMSLGATPMSGAQPNLGGSVCVYLNGQLMRSGSEADAYDVYFSGATTVNLATQLDSSDVCEVVYLKS